MYLYYIIIFLLLFVVVTVIIIIIIITAAWRFFNHKILEGLFIQQKHPSLNKQINCYIAKLFPAL